MPSTIMNGLGSDIILNPCQGVKSPRCSAMSSVHLVNSANIYIITVHHYGRFFSFQHTHHS